MACPFQGSQRSNGLVGTLPAGEPGSGHPLRYASWKGSGHSLRGKPRLERLLLLRLTASWLAEWVNISGGVH